MLYGDFNRDSIPDAAVGRLPVDSASQLRNWISRIRARESSDDFGSWRSRVQVIGGVGGFGKLADMGDRVGDTKYRNDHVAC